MERVQGMLDTMRVRFSVVCFVGKKFRVGCVGSLPELGNWDPQKCLPFLAVETPESEMVPSLWFADTDVPSVTLDTNDNSAIRTLLDNLNSRFCTKQEDVSTPSDQPRDVMMYMERQAVAAAQKELCEKVKGHELRNFEYKFVRWDSTSPLAVDYRGVWDHFECVDTRNGADTTLSQLRKCNSTILLDEVPSIIIPTIHSTSDNVVRILTDVLQQKPNCQSNIIWEGTGSGDNRRFSFCVYDIVIDKNPATKKYESIYVIQPAIFKEPSEAPIEYSHTTRYYTDVKNRNSIHYNKILDSVIVGTAPRNLSHIYHLKNDVGVTSVLNLQTEVDIRNNYMNCEKYPVWGDRTPETVYELYRHLNLAYVWIPTTDMSTSGRSEMVANAAHILHGLIKNGHRVYVHCNAGVGRSVAAAAAFVCYVLLCSVRKTNFLINAARAVAYWDEESILAGYRDYEKKFGKMGNGINREVAHSHN